MTSTIGVAVDGRTARRDRNCELVLDAVIELFTEHHFAPTPAEVAERSGVSLRSVYRYFADFDALVRAAIDRHQAMIAPLVAIPDLAIGPLVERIERFVACRLRLYEAAAPTARAAMLRAPTNPIMRQQLSRVRGDLCKQTAAMFEPELRRLPAPQRRAILAAVDTLTQFEGAENLRARLGSSNAQTADILRRSLTVLLTSTPEPETLATGEA